MSQIPRVGLFDEILAINNRPRYACPFDKWRLLRLDVVNSRHVTTWEAISFDLYCCRKAKIFGSFDRPRFRRNLAAFVEANGGGVLGGGAAYRGIRLRDNDEIWEIW
jgi:hypothetical protein